VAAGCLDGKGAEYVARLEVTWEAERDAALRAVMTGEDHPLKAAYMMPPDVEAAIMALHAEPEPEPEPDPKPAVARDLAARIAALPVAVLAEAIAALSPDDITTIESLLSDAEALALAKAILALTPEQKAEALKALLGGD